MLWTTSGAREEVDRREGNNIDNPARPKRLTNSQIADTRVSSALTRRENNEAGQCRAFPHARNFHLLALHRALARVCLINRGRTLRLLIEHERYAAGVTS